MCWVSVASAGWRAIMITEQHPAPRAGPQRWAELSWAEWRRGEAAWNFLRLLASSHRGHVTWPALTGVTWPGLHQSQPLLIITWPGQLSPGSRDLVSTNHSRCSSSSKDVGHNLQMEEWRHPRCDDGSVWVVMGTPSQYLLLLAACCDPGILPSRAEPSPALFRTG